MLLREIFQPGSKSASQFDVLDRNQHEAQYGFIVDDYHFIVMFEQWDDNLWEMSFALADLDTGESHSNIMNLGHSVSIRVLATVAEILRMHVGLYPTAKKITFSAKEPSRRSLYTRIARKLDPNFQIAKDGGYLVYTIQMKK